MIRTPAHLSEDAGQVTPGIAELHDLADAQSRRDAVELPDDFVVAYHGNITLLTPRTAEAKDWCSEHLPHDVQRWAGSIAVETRYIDDILEGITSEGFCVAEL